MSSVLNSGSKTRQVCLLLLPIGLFFLTLRHLSRHPQDALAAATPDKSWLSADSWRNTLPGGKNAAGEAGIGGAVGNNGGISKLVPVQKGPSNANGTKANAAFVVLARNSDLWPILESIRGIEDRFNARLGTHYPYVFLNDVPFDDTFKKHAAGLVYPAEAKFGLIDDKEWSQHPSWIDEEKARKAREKMEEDNVIYGGSLPYRHMCRYQSGYFFRHPLLDEYDYYWRIEPNIKFFCDVDYDPFVFMRDNKKKYGWTISIYEYKETIPTLWDETKKFIAKNPQYVAKNNLMNWVSNDNGDTYNLCHWWSNFEIGDLNFWRSEAYLKYFEHLDRAGGFFYERWGDAPVHSIAAALFLSKDEVHYFEDMGYRHEPFQHCPSRKNDHQKCYCDPSDDFGEHWYSCTKQYRKIVHNLFS